MNYNHPNKNSSTVSIRLMCAIVFMAYSFTYLFCFQADVMAVAQHVLSNGLTHYNPIVGAVVITLVLQILQLLVYAFIRLRKRSHALTYFPSLLGLALLTDVNSDIDRHFNIGTWWVYPLSLVLWALAALFARIYQEAEPDQEPTSLISRAMWINMLTMAMQIICMALLSNTNAVFHYRMRAEACMLKGDFSGALLCGRKSLESDVNLQMIRMYALTRTGELTNRLFEYPIDGHSDVMLPVEGKSRFAMYPVDSLYRYLGARPANQMSSIRYLQLLEARDSIIDRRIVDYQLCGLLIDKRIDDFACQLSHYYAHGDSLNIDTLPRHYREAMTLYTHLRSHPVLIYQNPVMEEDWNNLQELERLYVDPTERKGKVEEQYRGTYWYYYEYE